MHGHRVATTGGRRASSCSSASIAGCEAGRCTRHGTILWPGSSTSDKGSHSIHSGSHPSSRQRSSRCGIGTTSATSTRGSRGTVKGDGRQGQGLAMHRSCPRLRHSRGRGASHCLGQGQGLGGLGPGRLGGGGQGWWGRHVAPTSSPCSHSNLPTALPMGPIQGPRVPKLGQVLTNQGATGTVTMQSVRGGPTQGVGAGYSPHGRVGQHVGSVGGRRPCSGQPLLLQCKLQHLCPSNQQQLHGLKTLHFALQACDRVQELHLFLRPRRSISLELVVRRLQRANGCKERRRAPGTQIQHGRR